MAMLGLIGSTLIIVTGIGALLGVIEAGGAVQAIATIPEFLWELSLGIWPIVMGFNSSAAILSEPDAANLNGRGKEIDEKNLASV
jgi:hypothetical protein